MARSLVITGTCVGMRRMVPPRRVGRFAVERRTTGFATVEGALRHPTWQMGARCDRQRGAHNKGKSTEAPFVQPSYDRIEVVVHPQSVVHSFVKFIDSSVVAQ
jgi:1-deoxy-D-xylulose 5-phosphate reductoisomerase